MSIDKNLRMLNSSLKDMKKILSNKCSFLSAYKTSENKIKIKAIVKGETWLYPTPHNLVFTRADWQHLLSDINSKCNADVRE